MLTVCLSGPERTRAQAEVSLEAQGPKHGFRVPTLPDEGYAVMDWAAKIPAAPEGAQDEHGFISLLAEDADGLNAAVRVAEPFGWVLRLHHETPPRPRQSPITATLLEMQRRIAELEAKVATGHGVAR